MALPINAGTTRPGRPARPVADPAVEASETHGGFIRRGHEPTDGRTERTDRIAETQPGRAVHRSPLPLIPRCSFVRLPEVCDWTPWSTLT